MAISTNNPLADKKPKFTSLWFRSSHSYLMPVLPILFVFFIIEILIFAIHYVPTARIETDGAVYMFRSMGDLFQVDAFQGIGYPWAIRAFNTLGFPAFTSGRIVALIAGLVFIFCTYLIAYRLAGVRSAFIASVFVALNSNTLIQGSIVLSDMLAATMYIAAITMILVPDKPGRWYFLLAGGLSGYAYLTRYVYIFLLVLPLLFLVLQSSNKRKLIVSLLLFYVGFFLVTSPWMIYLYLEKGNPFYQTNQDNIILKYMSQLGFPDKRGIYSGFLDVIAAYPGTFVESMTKSLLQLPSDIFMTAITPVGIVGTLGGLIWVSKLDRRKILFLVPNLIYAALMLLVLLEPRYLLPLGPMVAIFVATSIDMIPERISAIDLPDIFNRIIRIIPLRLIVTLGLILIMFGFSGWDVLFTYSDKELAPEYVEAGQQLQAHLTHKVRLLGGRAQMMLWSNVEFVLGGADNVEELINVMEKDKIEYFAIDERYTAKNRPGLAILLNPDENPYPDKLKPVVQIDKPMIVIIYQYIP